MISEEDKKVAEVLIRMSYSGAKCPHLDDLGGHSAFSGRAFVHRDSKSLGAFFPCGKHADVYARDPRFEEVFEVEKVWT